MHVMWGKNTKAPSPKRNAVNLRKPGRRLKLFCVCLTKPILTFTQASAAQRLGFVAGRLFSVLCGIIHIHPLPDKKTKTLPREQAAVMPFRSCFYNLPCVSLSWFLSLSDLIS